MQLEMCAWATQTTGIVCAQAKAMMAPGGRVYMGNSNDSKRACVGKDNGNTGWIRRLCIRFTSGSPAKRSQA